VRSWGENSMRLAILICSFALLVSPAFAQQSEDLMPAPTEPMLLAKAPQAQKVPASAAQAVNQQSDQHFNRQVGATQQLIQAEERRLQSQFAQIAELRSAAIEKQDQKELARIEQIEKLVVVEYQKRVERILLSTQAQIQATTIHIDQTGKAQSTQQQPGTRTPSQSPQAQRSRTQPVTTARAQTSSQQGRAPSQPTQQRKSPSFWPFTH
ncbi:MAG: hypothetical protein ACYC6Y_04210, partial [Thermoguttaceae bacterium]